jgi:hypothetical protein
MLPAVPVITIVALPRVADVFAESVSVDEQVGLHDVGENEPLTPLGRPDTLNETVCADPEARVFEMVVVTESP